MVKELSITLNPRPIGEQYSPGSTLTGSLTVEVDEPKDYKALVVNLIGECKVEWSEGSKENRVIYSASEAYVSEQLVLWKK